MFHFERHIRASTVLELAQYTTVSGVSGKMADSTGMIIP